MLWISSINVQMLYHISLYSGWTERKGNACNAYDMSVAGPGSGRGATVAAATTAMATVAVIVSVHQN